MGQNRNLTLLKDVMNDRFAEKLDAFLFRFLGVIFGGGGCVALLFNNPASEVFERPVGVIFLFVFTILGLYSLFGILQDSILAPLGLWPASNESEKVESKEEAEEESWMLREYIKAGLAAILLALFIRTFVAQAFKIPSESMVETLQVGDHLLVNKLQYLISDINRGDVIVFQYPKDTSRDFVKRVVGLPGETIEMKGNRVYIDDKPIDEPYAIYINNGYGLNDDRYFPPLKVPEGHLFMMGDNRNNSQDSRVWGPLDINLIHGKAFIIHWSWKGDSFGVRWGRVGGLLE